MKILFYCAFVFCIIIIPLRSSCSDCEEYCKRYKEKDFYSVCLDGCTWSYVNLPLEACRKKYKDSLCDETKIVATDYKATEATATKRFVVKKRDNNDDNDDNKVDIKKSISRSTIVADGKKLSYLFNYKSGQLITYSDASSLPNKYNGYCDLIITEYDFYSMKVKNRGNKPVTTYQVVIMYFNDFHDNVTNDGLTITPALIKFNNNKNDYVRLSDYIYGLPDGTKIMVPVIFRVAYSDGSICQIGINP